MSYTITAPERTIAENIGQTLDHKLESLACIQGEIDICQDTMGYVPAYLLAQLEDATSDLSAYAEYWSMDVEQYLEC